MRFSFQNFILGSLGFLGKTKFVVEKLFTVNYEDVYNSNEIKDVINSSFSVNILHTSFKCNSLSVFNICVVYKCHPIKELLFRN